MKKNSMKKAYRTHGAVMTILTKLTRRSFKRKKK